MKIAYVAQVEIKREDGVLKKITQQISAWQAAGHEVCLFVCCRRSEIWDGIARLPHQVYFYDGFLESFTQFQRLAREVQAWSPGVVYLRFLKYYPGLAHLVSALPTVMEINTDDLAETRVVISRNQYWYHRCTRHRLLGKAAGLVYVTKELSELPHNTCFHKPGLVMGNSTDLGSFPVLPAPANDQPHLVFMGSATFPWFGLDKILALARQCADWHFDIIGMTHEEIAQDDLPNVYAHGTLGRTEYEGILAGADVAIGTLALHRIGMNEASPLKIREYLAYGLPVIIGYGDTDFPTPPWFIHQLPNREDNVGSHTAGIRQFVAQCRGKRVAREDITHLDTPYKEQERLRFITATAGLYSRNTN